MGFFQNFYVMTGQHLQDLIKKEGYSVSKMAELIGTSQQVLASALKHDDIRTGLVEKVAQVMGKPLSFFYGETYGPVTQVTGNSNTQVAGNVVGNDMTVGLPDSKLIELLVSKDKQLTLSMQQTAKAMDQTTRAMEHTTRAMEQACKSQGQIDELIKLINR